MSRRSSSFGHAVHDLVATLRADGMPSARNLLVTVFGDAVATTGVAVSVQSLVRLLEGVGVNDRLVRTSLTRLVRDGLLRNERVGRQSFYSIDPASLSLFEGVESRIYHHEEAEWDGRWTFAIVDAAASDAAGRTALRRELSWLGMGSVAPNVLASPNLQPDDLIAALERIGGAHQVLVTRGAAEAGALTMSDEEISMRCAPIEELSAQYAEVVDWFGPVAAALGRDRAPSPQACWTTRLLLVATFRRVALVDPRMPRRLLPAGWAGTQARDLAASLYERLHGPAESWLSDVCSNPVSPWSSESSVANRFR